jgi:hypothetical protein
MSTTGRRAATETGPVNGLRSPLNLSIKLILHAWASSNIHHQLNLWAFFLVLQQIMSSTLLPCSSPPRLLLRCSVSTPSTQQSLPSPIPWLLMLPGGLRRLLLYSHTAVAVILLLQRFSFFLCIEILLGSSLLARIYSNIYASCRYWMKLGVTCQNSRAALLISFASESKFFLTSLSLFYFFIFFINIDIRSRLILRALK